MILNLIQNNSKKISSKRKGTMKFSARSCDIWRKLSIQDERMGHPI